MSSSSTSGRSRTAAAASSRESGCPRASRFTLRASAASRPALVRSSPASPSSRLPSRTLRTSSLQPGVAYQLAMGGSRPARTSRVLSRRAGANARRTQLSSRRRISYVSRTSTTRSPSPARRSAASSALVGAPPTAFASRSRKPRSVGSIDRQSIMTTVSPRLRASRANASRSVDLPTPAIPCTKTTSGPPSSSVWSRAAFSAVRPKISADRSSTSSRIVRLTRVPR